MARFAVVDFDDWVALYKDGKKIIENHSLRLQDVLDECEVDVEYISVDYDTSLGNYIEEQGSPPETITEVKEIINND